MWLSLWESLRKIASSLNKEQLHFHCKAALSRYKPISAGKEFIILSKNKQTQPNKMVYKLQLVLMPRDCCYLLFEGKEKRVTGLSVMAASF